MNFKNIGELETRLRAINLSKGEWIAFIDSDDIWSPDKLEKQTDLQKETGCALVYTASSFINENGKMFKWIMHVPEEVSYKRLLRQNDELQLVVYLIGECNVSSGYINLFFEEYLNHHIAGSFFLIKQLKYSQIELSKIKRNTLSFSSLFEKDSFKNVYNNMMIYYKNNYGMDLSILEGDYEMLNTIESSLEPRWED